MNGLKIRFVQIGECGINASFFANRDDVEVIESSSPSKASAIFAKSDFSYIPDVQIALPYTPFMPSKFVYQLFSDKPLILYTRPGSPMHDCYVKFPGSGLFFADYTIPDSLGRTIAEAYQYNGHIDREAIRSPFTRHGVASQFCEFVNSI